MVARQATFTDMLKESFFRKLGIFLEEAEPPRAAHGRVGDHVRLFIGMDTDADADAFESDEDAETLESFVRERRDAAFSEKLFAYIDKKVMIDAYVYKKAGIDRRLFSKIRSKEYHPGKDTVLLLGLALELDLHEIEDLLASAGYSLSRSDTADLIVAFCVLHRIYSVADVNLALDRFGQKALGAGK